MVHPMTKTPQNLTIAKPVKYFEGVMVFESATLDFIVDRQTEQVSKFHRKLHHSMTQTCIFYW